MGKSLGTQRKRKTISVQWVLRVTASMTNQGGIEHPVELTNELWKLADDCRELEGHCLYKTTGERLYEYEVIRARLEKFGTSRTA
jgi:hypothetical protein